MTYWRMAAIAAASLLAIGGPFTGQQGRRALSGDLTKPIEQYSGNEFFAHVRGLGFGPVAQRDRRCRGAACSAGRRTRMSADAVADADSLSAGNLPQYGTIAARVLNLGAETEDRYGMQAGPRFHYFLIVYRGAPGAKARWGLEELEVRSGAAIHHTVATGVLTPCNHPFRRGARADFKTCATAGAGPVSFVSLGQDGDEPLWIGCASGCCTADPGT